MARKIIIKAVNKAPEGKENEFNVNDEWVCIANEGTTTEFIEGWILLNLKADGKHYYHFYFPAEVDGIRLNFKPGQLIFVTTGPGKDIYYPATEGNPSQFHFFQGFDKLIWNEAKDRVNLYSLKKDNNTRVFELVAQREITHN